MPDAIARRDPREYYQIVTAEDIVAVVEALVPDRITARTARTLEVDCPVHASQSRRALHVDRTKQVWHCWGCGVGGDVLAFVEWVQSGTVTRGASGIMPDSHRTARDWLAERAGLPPLAQWGITPEQAAEVERRRAVDGRVFGVLTAVARYYHERLLASPDVLAWVETKYGFTREVVEAYGLGYAANDPWIDHDRGTHPGAREALMRGADEYTVDELAASGAFRAGTAAPFFDHRLIFPYYSRGAVRYLIGRQTPWTPATDWERAKYKKLPVHRDDDARRSHIAECVSNDALWGEDCLLGRPHHVVVTEGVADAVAIAAVGFAVVSPTTVQFKADGAAVLAERLVRAGVSRVSVLMDNELSEVGIRSALKVGRELSRRVSRVAVVTLPLQPSHLAARAELRDRFDIVAPVSAGTLTKRMEGQPEDRVREALALLERSKLDAADYFRTGGSPAAFAVLTQTAPGPVEHVIRSLPEDLPAGDERDALLEPILAEIAGLPAMTADRMLAILKEQVKSLPSKSVLREATRSAPKPKDNGTARFTPKVTSGFHLTDIGNAERLVAAHGTELAHSKALGWLAWDGRRWVEDSTGEVDRRAIATVRTIYAEAADRDDPNERRATADWAKSSEARGRIESMISLARSAEGVAVGTDGWDRDKLLLTCLNGTVDLRTGTLRPHDPADRITKCAPVEYDPAATCPTWDRFLSEIMGGDEELIAFLRRAVGYSLTGETSERCAFILFGVGANGKSTFVETVRALLGDYAVRTPTETLLARREGQGATSDIARLRGARFVAAAEIEQDRRLAEAKIKDLTGGEAVTARFMYRELFEFKPECKFWISTNHKPRITGTDHGIWDRIRLVPFEVRIPPERQDHALGTRLIAEWPGVLAWAVRGAVEWGRDGLGYPAKVADAVGAYRTEMDTLGRFLDDVCVAGDQFRAPASALYAAYKEWCEASGEFTIRQVAFGQRLVERGFVQVKGSKGVRFWSGLTLRAALGNQRGAETRGETPQNGAEGGAGGAGGGVAVIHPRTHMGNFLENVPPAPPAPPRDTCAQTQAPAPPLSSIDLDSYE